MLGCKSNQIEYPPTPKRQEITFPTNQEEYIELILYYETLVQQWEAWSNCVMELNK